MTIIWMSVISLGVLFGFGEYTTVKENNVELTEQVESQAATIDALKKSAVKKPFTRHTLDGITVEDLSLSSGASV